MAFINVDGKMKGKWERNFGLKEFLSLLLVSPFDTFQKKILKHIIIPSLRNSKTTRCRSSLNSFKLFGQDGKQSIVGGGRKK